MKTTHTVLDYSSIRPLLIVFQVLLSVLLPYCVFVSSN